MVAQQAKRRRGISPTRRALTRSKGEAWRWWIGAVVCGVPRSLTRVATTAIGLPIVGQIRKPHPAIRELVDHPKRVDLPAEIRRRVHLISHTLVQEALRRGWKVIGVHSENE